MYEFDASLQAKATLKERFVWIVFLGATFFILYGAANQYAHLTAPHPALFMDWEIRLPFVEWLIVPYMSSDILFCIAFLLPYTRLELRILAVRVLLIITGSVLFFVLLPLQFSFQKPEITAFTFLFGLLQADLPYNQLPSLHISFAIVLWASMRTKIRSLILRTLIAIWLVLIAVSTLLVYQHHFIDIPTGVLAGLIALYLVPASKPSYLTDRFSTPRHIKIGLYYLAGALCMLLAAFWSPWFQWLFLWIFISLLLVSIIYAFGFNDLLAGRRGKANLLQWIVFAPYFIGSYLCWHYYRRKIPLMSHVKSHVYLGRYPTSDEYEKVKAEGIVHAINLATEQQVQSAAIRQTRYPFLDLTIQSPQSLYQMAKTIEAASEKTYVHCALGLSRSVLAVASWLLYKGHTIEEVKQLIGHHRVPYLESAYMQVALDLYQNYLKNMQLETSRA